MSRFRRRILAGSVITLCFLAGASFLMSAEEEAAAPSSVAPAIPGKIAAAAAGPGPVPATITTADRGVVRSFVISLDEALRKGPDGEDITLKIDPPATLATLRERLATFEGEVFPVCYEPGKPHEPRFRKVITRNITLKLPSPDVMPALPAGIVLKERPSYAPEFAIVSAADPLAAIAALDALRALPMVEAVELQLGSLREKRAMPNDTLIAQQWHLKFQNQSGALTGTDVNIENAWLYGGSGGVRGSGINIGIVDDGLQTAHPDLSANVDTVNDKDWNGNDSDPNPGTFDHHGTSCAGNAAARGNNGLGVSGTAPEAKLVGMRLISSTVEDFQEAEAMSYLPQLIQIKSNSWGPKDDGKTLEGPGSLTRAALKNAAETGRGGLGSIILWAGGNGLEDEDNSNYDGYANDIHTIAIAASDSRGRQADYSEPGANLVVTAPSDGASPALGITTTDRTGSVGYSSGDYATDFGGTSSATPTAAGIVALMLQKKPGLGWRDMQEILMRSARKMAPADGDWANNSAGFHFNHKFGAGLIDATAAVNMASTWTNLPAKGTPQTVAQSGLAVNIPDNDPTGITRSFQFTGTNRRVEHVEVTVSITHAYRRELAVTLTSPSGMTSRLAEKHKDGEGSYSEWTFSSVRHWGELSNGTWTLKIEDRVDVDIGTLTAASVTIHGPPNNPAPAVAITSPAGGTIFDAGQTVNVAVNATDLNGDNNPATVASVQLLDNGSPVATDMTPPFSFELQPASGSHSYAAVATDAQSLSTTSAAVAVTVKSAYDTWISGFPGLASTLKTADPDHDGIANVVEYHLGSPPNAANAQDVLPVLAKSGDSLTLTWWKSKSATDVTATVEWADTLETWHPEGIALEVITDEPVRAQMRATLPLSPGDPRRFLRLRVE